MEKLGRWGGGVEEKGDGGFFFSSIRAKLILLRSQGFVVGDYVV